jgi:glycogen operon protein
VIPAVALLLIGTPMILMGDQVWRTQYGNNNAYCQNNELSWLDWSLLEKHSDLYRFVKLVLHARLQKTFQTLN